jgi:ribose-phosphate pyrophosphokinase
VRAEEVVGEVAGRPVVIVDDMISTGATIVSAVQALLAHGAAGEVAVVATHGLFVGPAEERLAALSLRCLLVTDSLATSKTANEARAVASIAPLLADAVECLHRDDALDHLLLRT